MNNERKLPKRTMFFVVATRYEGTYYIYTYLTRILDPDAHLRALLFFEPCLLAWPIRGANKEIEEEKHLVDPKQTVLSVPKSAIHSRGPDLVTLSVYPVCIIQGMSIQYK